MLILTASGAPAVAIKANTTVTGNITSSGNIQCVGLTQTSDESIKTNVLLANQTDAQTLLDQISVKTYEQTDVPGNRICFIAQDFDNIPQEWQI